jgi:hypothetical protein
MGRLAALKGHELAFDSEVILSYKIRGDEEQDLPVLIPSSLTSEFFLPTQE